VKQWLAERLQVLLPRLAVLGKDQEGEIQLLCEEEIAAWRQRPTMKSIRSLNTPMIDARNAIKEQLAVTPENSWLNPRSGEREHLARKYLNFSEAEWAAMHVLTEQGRKLRLEGQTLGEPVLGRRGGGPGSHYWAATHGDPQNGGFSSHEFLHGPIRGAVETEGGAAGPV